MNLLFSWKNNEALLETQHSHPPTSDHTILFLKKIVRLYYVYKCSTCVDSAHMIHICPCEGWKLNPEPSQELLLLALTHLARPLSKLGFSMLCFTHTGIHGILAFLPYLYILYSNIICSLLTYCHIVYKNCLKDVWLCVYGSGCWEKLLLFNVCF